MTSPRFHEVELLKRVPSSWSCFLWAPRGGAPLGLLARVVARGHVHGLLGWLPPAALALDSGVPYWRVRDVCRLRSGSSPFPCPFIGSLSFVGFCGPLRQLGRRCERLGIGNPNSEANLMASAGPRRSPT